MKKWWSYIQNKYIFATVLFMIYSLFLDDVDIFTIVNHNRKLNKLEVSKMETAHKLDSTQHLLETLRYDDQLESFAREYEPLHVAKKRTNQVYTYLTKKPFQILAEQECKPAFSISNDIYKHYMSSTIKKSFDDSEYKKMTPGPEDEDMI